MANSTSRMVRIKLTKNKYALIDNEDLDLVSQCNWHYTKTGYAQSNKKYWKVLMHRFILGFPKYNIDHINRNGLDNRRENLRFCNQSQNMANSGIRKTNQSGYKGVTYDKRNPNMKWVANLTKNYKHVYIGAFKTKEDAAMAYNIRAIKEFGDFAFLNKI